MSNKLRIAMTAGLAVLIPTAAFAAHVATCCGDWLCCLRHLGCCP